MKGWISKGPADDSTCTGAGAAYGTAKAGIGIAGVGTFRPDLIMKVCSAIIATLFVSTER